MMDEYIFKIEPTKKDDLSEITYIYNSEIEVGIWKTDKKQVTTESKMLEKFEKQTKNGTNKWYSIKVYDGLRDTVIGLLTLDNIDEYYQNAYINYCIHKMYQKKGYGSKTIKFAINTAKKELKLVKLLAHVDSKNEVSRKLLVKHGFNVVGKLEKQAKYEDGQWMDIHLLDMVF